MPHLLRHEMSITHYHRIIRFVLFVCFCFGFFTSDVDQPLSQIRLNLSVNIGAGQIIFLAGIKSTRDTVSHFKSLKYFKAH